MVEFFREQEAFPLPIIERNQDLAEELKKHLGAYALFYTGPFDLYEALVRANSGVNRLEFPIYVGKAVPVGDRTGIPARGRSNENSLYRRLREHLRSIRQVHNLNEGDFYFKVIPTSLHSAAWVESVLISYFRPIWNTHISGFGIHDPGGGRYRQKRSVWDQIHPGRPWATRMQDLAPYNIDEIRQKINKQYEAIIDRT